MLSYVALLLVTSQVGHALPRRNSDSSSSGGGPTGPLEEPSQPQAFGDSFLPGNGLFGDDYRPELDHPELHHGPNGDGHLLPEVPEYEYGEKDYGQPPIEDKGFDYGENHPTDEHSNEEKPKDLGNGSDKDENTEVGIKKEEEKMDGKEVAPFFHSGFVFDVPFFNLQQVTRYFKQLERAMDQVFRQTLEEASLLNGTYANTTEEEVDIDGRKYKVQKSIIKTGGDDKNSSLFIEAISSVAEHNRTKRSNWLAEPYQ